MELAINGGKPIRSTPLYYGKQYIDDADIEAVVETLKAPLITTGPKVEELQNRLCQITEAKYGVAMANGTAALHGACFAAGIGVDDEVITTPMTFAASSNSVLYLGGKPVFADINPETYNIDPQKVEEAITKKTKAVIAVDYTGQAAELDKLIEICKEYNLVLIEDASHSIGTKYKNKPVGSIADLTTFSFHPVKTITGGEGGAVMTNREEYRKKLLLFRTHGITREEEMFNNVPHGTWYYEQLSLGYNFRLTDIQSALVISQLNKLDAFSRRRKEITKQYDEAFYESEMVVTQKVIPESDTTSHLYVLQLNLEKLTVDRKGFFDALWAENICCNVHYIPVYYSPYYEQLGYKKGICPKAERLYERIITLPLYYSMTNQDVEDVINGVFKVLNFYRKQ